MELTIDNAGRLMIPKAFREALGMLPGYSVDVSCYGACLQVTPGSRTAGLVTDQNGRLVGDGSGAFTDDLLFAMIDEGRR